MCSVLQMLAATVRGSAIAENVHIRSPKSYSCRKADRFCQLSHHLGVRVQHF